MRKISISAPDAKTIFRIFIALVLAYLLPGLIGHDPWKQDETYIFGIIQHLLETGDWVVPTLAGEPFMEKPPLFYWLAAGLAHLCRHHERGLLILVNPQVPVHGQHIGKLACQGAFPQFMDPAFKVRPV